MDDWKDIWNFFCSEVAEMVKNKQTEKAFERDTAKEFFLNLGWKRVNHSLEEQYPITFATSKHKADFALFLPGKQSPEIIVELKRPAMKKREEHVEQMLDYMDRKECSFGILMMGDFMELHYRDYSAPKTSNTLVETIKYQKDSEAAHQLLDVLYHEAYEPAKMLEYCHKRVKVNKSVEYWCSEDGKTEILNMIVERSQLPEHLLETLRSTLVVDVKRRDGLAPVSQQPVSATPATQQAVTTKKPQKDGKREPKVWMISASAKFFDHRKCFDELGQIYWKQHNNLQAGDTGYIYFSKPQQQVVFKYEIIACDLPYTAEYDTQKKYYKKAEDFEDAIKHNRFYLIKKIGESTSGKLTLSNMMQNGLKQAPLGALNLSDKSFEQLLAYIEENF